MLYESIPLSQFSKEEYLDKTLNKLMCIGRNKTEQDEIDEERAKYAISFDEVTVDVLRERIETFNNLIVRLPTDTYHNKMASRHIFQDWKAFVDGAVERLIKRKELFRKMHADGKTPIYETDYGTEVIGKDISGNEIYKSHEYSELYVDDGFTTPLIDYSYCKDEFNRPIHDRWDFWSEDDFR